MALFIKLLLIYNYSDFDPNQIRLDQFITGVLQEKAEVEITAIPEFLHRLRNNVIYNTITRVSLKCPCPSIGHKLYTFESFRTTVKYHTAADRRFVLILSSIVVNIPVLLSRKSLQNFIM